MFSLSSLRDMLMGIIEVEAKEEGRDVKTLNYAPGPMDTDMQKVMREDNSHGPSKEFWKQQKAEVSPTAY